MGYEVSAKYCRVLWEGHEVKSGARVPDDWPDRVLDGLVAAGALVAVDGAVVAHDVPVAEAASLPSIESIRVVAEAEGLELSGTVKRASTALRKLSEQGLDVEATFGVQA